MDPTQRFSNRVDNYVRYRPGYPMAVAGFFRDTLGMTSASVVADVGSGTGKLTEVFLDAGVTVLAVEPNDEMRAAADRLFGARSNYRGVAARAEATGLADASVDFVVAGQAFHWFDAGQARAEFRRILKPGGYAALVYNERRTTGGGIAVDYERLMLECCPEYATSPRRSVGRSAIEAFFGQERMRTVEIENAQTLALDGLLGRILSSSYTPTSGPDYDRLVAALPELFAKYQKDGFVTIPYDTEVFYGQL